MKLTNIGCLLLLLVSPVILTAQSAPVVLNSRSYGAGGAGATFQDIHAAYGNQAGLTALTGWAVQATASRRFGLAELAQIGMAIAMPLQAGGTVFAQARSFGFDAYRESMLAAGYARRLSAGLSVAAQFNLYQFNIDGYGTSFDPGYELGLLQHVSPVLRMGLQVINPVPIPASDGIELPSVFTLGLAYAPAPDITVFAEVEKHAEFEPRVKLGVEWDLHEALRLRAGGSSGPGMVHAGLSYRFPHGLGIDAAAAHHPSLGMTPVVGLTYNQQ
ncbi:MAG: hypothetical protein R3301_05950 [Saprospiraceae bacterium]|nr:hypothetical protein [Saprospiraceae bacterium]